MKKNTLLLFAVLMTYCMGVWADGDWTIIEEPTCSKYGTMQNPANTSELRLVPKLAHHFDSDGKCTVCHHPAPTKYNGTPAESLVTITESNYATYGLTAKNKSCVMGWKVITTAEEFMRYINNDGNWSAWIEFNAFLAEDIILDNTVNLPNKSFDTGGVFDGTGHTISNMYRSDENWVGLYNDNRGTIRNLGLISPKIEVSGGFGGCISSNNTGIIENCFVIDGHIEGSHDELYGIAYQNSGGQIINCYAISNKGNVGRTNVGTITNSYGATTGSDDFYSNTLNGLNANKVNGITWYHSSASYPVMMPSMTQHFAKSATCTEDGQNECWQCAVCGKYFLDACHSQETSLIVPALGHDMKCFDEVEATCVTTGTKEYHHCNRCEKNFDDVVGTNEIVDLVIPINPQSHPSELQYIAEVEATCVAPGTKEHWYCDQCKKNFKDEAGTNEIVDLVIPINPNNHSLTLVNDKAHCDQCNQDFSNFVSIGNGKPAWLTKENDEYYLKADDGFTLQDGVNYLAPVDFIVDGTFTYSRNVSVVKAGAWQCWYEPFDLQLTEDVLKKMDVAEVAGVLLDNEGSTIVAFKKIDTGWIKANTPYVFRPKDAILKTGSLELTMVAPQLRSSEETTFYNMSTYDKFTFGGNYKAQHNDSWYTLNTSGEFQKMKEGVNLKGQRFWMTITAREDIPYEYGGIANAKEFINFTVLGDDETTGIENPQPSTLNPQPSLYDLQGRKVKNIQHGQIYIMNGKKYIVR